MKRVDWLAVCRTLLLATTCAMPSGCYLLGTGKLTVRPAGTMPTVKNMVDHIACVIGTAFDQGITSPEVPTQQMWERLYENNFVASVDLTLTVTDNEGFNPSFSAITPLTGAGAKLDPLNYANRAGMVNGTASSNNYNRTLAVGLQLSSVQDRNVEQDYLIDLHVLIDEFEAAQRSATTAKNKDDPTFPNCGSVVITDPKTKVDPNESQFSRADKVTSPLQGNLHLTELIEDGLSALDQSRTYNVYGTTGPAAASPRQPVPTFMTAPVPPLPVQNAAVPGLQAISDIGIGAGGAKASFSSKIDFFITAGINGGPSLVTLTKKVGAGGSGGGGGGNGGGGGGSGGNGGGGGGGGSGGGQLLNATRMTQDSLTITFGATCYSPRAEVFSITKITRPSPKADPSKSDADEKPTTLCTHCVVNPPTTTSPTPVQALTKIEGKVKVAENYCDNFRFTDGMLKPQPDDKKQKGQPCDEWEFELDAPIPDGPNDVPATVPETSPDSYPRALPKATSHVRITPTHIENVPTPLNSDLLGSIAWTGYQYESGSYFLSGTVRSLITDAIVGQIWLHDPDRAERLNPGEEANPILGFPVYIDGALDGVGDPHTDYWYTIPNCDAITIEQRQQAGDNIKSQNQLTHLLQ